MKSSLPAICVFFLCVLVVNCGIEREEIDYYGQKYSQKIARFIDPIHIYRLPPDEHYVDFRMKNEGQLLVRNFSTGSVDLYDLDSLQQEHFGRRGSGPCETDVIRDFYLFDSVLYVLNKESQTVRACSRDLSIEFSFKFSSFIMDRGVICSPEILLTKGSNLTDGNIDFYLVNIENEGLIEKPLSITLFPDKRNSSWIYDGQLVAKRSGDSYDGFDFYYLCFYSDQFFKFSLNAGKIVWSNGFRYNVPEIILQSSDGGTMPVEHDESHFFDAGIYEDSLYVLTRIYHEDVVGQLVDIYSTIDGKYVHTIELRGIEEEYLPVSEMVVAFDKLYLMSDDNVVFAYEL